MAVPSSHTDAERTLNASAFSRIRADILTCLLLPNERLRMEGLRERYGIGASPIREALMRLEAEGLVELEQNRGFKVSEVSPSKLADLMRTRIEIESIALRWSLEMGSLEWEADLISSFHRLSKQTKLSDQSRVRSVRSGSRSTPIFMAHCWRHAIPNRFFSSARACSSRPNVTLPSRSSRTARSVTT